MARRSSGGIPAGRRRTLCAFASELLLKLHRNRAPRELSRLGLHGPFAHCRSVHALDRSRVIRKGIAVILARMGSGRTRNCSTTVAVSRAARASPAAAANAGEGASPAKMP